ncbi:hypothetical protein F4802DRAFT_88955 [Xylaria palmicola]|nr:hypothetical protein F4802DRAFT_88955 [Xylaria palmicola]
MSCSVARQWDDGRLLSGVDKRCDVARQGEHRMTGPEQDLVSGYPSAKSVASTINVLLSDSTHRQGQDGGDPDRTLILRVAVLLVIPQKNYGGLAGLTARVCPCSWSPSFESGQFVSQPRRRQTDSLPQISRRYIVYKTEHLRYSNHCVCVRTDPILSQVTRAATSHIAAKVPSLPLRPAVPGSKPPTSKCPEERIGDAGAACCMIFDRYRPPDWLADHRLPKMSRSLKIPQQKLHQYCFSLENTVKV